MSYQIDATRGEVRGDVSRQWANRPADQRFLSLPALRDQVHTWANQSSNREISPIEIDVASVDDRLILQLGDLALEPTHYGMGALARLAGVPSAYLRDQRVPTDLAAACLLNGLATATQDKVAAYIREPIGFETMMASLRALTSTKYGRIYDYEVVDAVMKIAGNGTGDSRWKVPGCIDWSAAGGTAYNPEAPVTRDSTTLYASDRDLFLFLVDDRNPVEVGLLPSGSPDLMFRGFYCWNSEVGERTFGVASMWLRGVCQNRNLWGVEEFDETVIRHTQGAPDRFASEFAPVLEAYAESGVGAMAAKVQKAKAITFSDRKAEPQVEFLIDRMGFTKKQAAAILRTDPDGFGDLNEPRQPGNLWQLSNAATAWTRTIEHQDTRQDAELRIGKAVDRAIA